MKTDNNLNNLASTLPYYILSDIFNYVLCEESTDIIESNVVNEITNSSSRSSSIAGDATRGGKLITWQSNESIKSMSLVCRGWLDSAQSILYKSIAIFGSQSAKNFLRTCKTRVDLKLRVKFLVIGLGDMKESSGTVLGQREESEDLVEALEICAGLQHLQVRPLHSSLRTRLLSAIASHTSLLSLVCAPRLIKKDVVWTQELYHSTDPIILASPNLIRLELDFWSTPVLLPSPLPIILPLNLVELRLQCEVPHELLYLLLAAAGSTLQVADLYFEKLLDLEEMTVALSTSVQAMKKLRYISNPTLDELDNFNASSTPIFDRVLPHYQQLERLFISATEVSTNLFRLLPPSLKDLEVQSFNHHGTFYYSNELLLALRDPSIQFTLESFTVFDAAEVWEDSKVLIRKACSDRGISFFFAPDSGGAESD